MCNNCRKSFQNKSRKSHRILTDYIQGKQTYKQTAERHGLSSKSVQRELDSLNLEMHKLIPRSTVIGMDTCYFGNLGLSLIRDLINKEDLIWAFTAKENQNLYRSLYEKLIDANFNIMGIVVDGRSSYYKSFGEVPIQMCHFHMAKILRKYLTKNPNLKFNKELWKIWYSIKDNNLQNFTKELFYWYCSYVDELTEMYIDSETNKYIYVRERTLKAYKSLRRFTPYLFTYQTSRWIPNTNNSIEGTFSQLKAKLRVHNGLRWDRKAKVIHCLLSEK